MFLCQDKLMMTYASVPQFWKSIMQTLVRTGITYLGHGTVGVIVFTNENQ